MFFLQQLIRGGYKLSFRSRCSMDCNEVAQQFGGGGHKAASGAFFEGTLEDAQSKVLAVVKAAVEKAIGA